MLKPTIIPRKLLKSNLRNQLNLFLFILDLTQSIMMIFMMWRDLLSYFIFSIKWTFSTLLSFFHTFHLDLFFCLGHYTEKWELLLETVWFTDYTDFALLDADSRTAHGFVGWEGFVESIVFSWEGMTGV